MPEMSTDSSQGDAPNAPVAAEPVAPSAAEPPVPSAPVAPANVRVSVRVGPLSSVLGDVAGLLAEAAQSLLAMFYPLPTARRSNVVITELVTNVLENVVDPASDFTMDLAINGDVLEIAVCNTVAPEQYEKIRARVEQLQNHAEAKKLLVKTIRERRPQRMKGGLGLIRLVAKNRFALTSEYADGRATVRAQQALKVNA